MTIKSQNNFTHKQSAKIGVLITNLGTPSAPTKKALRTYLKEFLSDPRIVEIPRIPWWIILNGIILNTRPAKSAVAYKRIWTDQGSPLAVHTANQSAAIAEELKKIAGDQIVVDWAMRYGTPSIADALQKMQDKGVEKLLVFPLYPHYSGASSGSMFDAIAKDFTHRRWVPDFRFIGQYYRQPDYINALSKSITDYWQVHGQPQKLIFSYHGVPLHYLHKGDPYYCHCMVTTRLVAEQLALREDQYTTTFQSRFGRAKWLEPATDDTLKALPGQGVTDVQVVCPGFSADCLETIDEIALENKEYFLHAGGKNYSYIPALNSDPDHIAALTGIVLDNLEGWFSVDNGMNDIDVNDRSLAENRYQNNLFNKPQRS